MFTRGSPKNPTEIIAFRGDVVLQAVKNNCAALRFAGDTPRGSRPVVMEAVRLCGTVLYYAAEALQAEPEVFFSHRDRGRLMMGLNHAEPWLNGYKKVR